MQAPNTIYGERGARIVGIVISGLLVALVAFSTQVAVKLNVTAAYVICAVAVAIAFAWYEIVQVDAAAHFLAAAAITWYQSFFIFEHIHARWWLEGFIIATTFLIHLIDVLVVYKHSPARAAGAAGTSSSECMPEDTRASYGYLTGMLLVVMGFIPLHGTGLFAVRTPLHGAALLLLWGAFAYTDSQRRLRMRNVVRVTHSATKSLAFFYLPPRYWVFLMGMVLVNVTQNSHNPKDGDAKEDLESHGHAGAEDPASSSSYAQPLIVNRDREGGDDLRDADIHAADE